MSKAFIAYFGYLRHFLKQNMQEKLIVKLTNRQTQLILLIPLEIKY